jgi:hypothetical protein
LGKRASDQTQTGQQTQYDEQSGGGTTSSSHSLSFLLGSFVLNEAGEPGRDETHLGSAEDPVPSSGPVQILANPEENASACANVLNLFFVLFL